MTVTNPWVALKQARMAVAMSNDLMRAHRICEQFAGRYKALPPSVRAAVSKTSITMPEVNTRPITALRQSAQAILDTIGGKVIVDLGQFGHFVAKPTPVKLSPHDESYDIDDEGYEYGDFVRVPAAKWSFTLEERDVTVALYDYDTNDRPVADVSFPSYGFTYEEDTEITIRTCRAFAQHFDQMLSVSGLLDRAMDYGPNGERPEWLCPDGTVLYKKPVVWA